MKLSELILHACEAKLEHGDIEVAVYEAGKLPLTVKSDIVSVTQVRDGHGMVMNDGKPAFIILA